VKLPPCRRFNEICFENAAFFRFAAEPSIIPAGERDKRPSVEGRFSDWVQAGRVSVRCFQHW